VQTEDAALIGALWGVIPILLRQKNVLGLNIAVARRGAMIWEEAFGIADLATRRPMAPDTVFRSGSMGKTYTATAVMQLVEDGRVVLKGDVSAYVGFEVTNPLGDRPVPIEDLLTHRSGLMENCANPSFGPPPPLEEHLRADFACRELDLYRGLFPNGARRWVR